MSAHHLRLRRTKVKEMEVRPFRTLVMQRRDKEVANYFSCFWRTKSSSMGSIDAGGSRDTHRTMRAYGILKIKMIRILSNYDLSVDLIVLIATM